MRSPFRRAPRQPQPHFRAPLPALERANAIAAARRRNPAIFKQP
jgi:hypothetical protein